MGGIRLFLACGVLILHLNEQVLRPIGLSAQAIWVSNLIGGRAVIFFYIVSGFLISYVLNGKYSQSTSGTQAFYRSRFLRIYPLWWALLFFCVAAGPRPWMGHGPELFATSALIGSDWIVAFWHYPVPHWSVFTEGTEIGWTLGAELAFYLAAPWVLRSNRLAMALFAGSLAVRALALWMVAPDDPGYKTWTYLFFPSVLVFFLLGHFAEKLHRSRPIGLTPSIALLIAAVAAACRLDDSTSLGSPWFHVAALCFAAALPGIFAATKDNRVSTCLGDLTYPLYLTHVVVISAVFSGTLSGIGQGLIAGSGMFTSIELKSMFVVGSILAIALCVAAAIHVAIERPLRAAFAWLLDSGGRKIATLARRMIAKSPLSDAAPRHRGG